MFYTFPQVGQLKISLSSVLDQWSLYKQASEEINGYLMEGRYSVSRFRLLTGSLEAVQLQVQSLQVCLIYCHRTVFALSFFCNTVTKINLVLFAVECVFYIVPQYRNSLCFFIYVFIIPDGW